MNKGASDLKAGIDTLNSSLSDEKTQKDLASLVSGSAQYKKGITDLSDNLGKMAAGYSIKCELSKAIDRLLEMLDEQLKD